MEGSLFQESGCRRDTEGTEEGNTEGTEGLGHASMDQTGIFMPSVIAQFDSQNLDLYNIINTKKLS